VSSAAEKFAFATAAPDQPQLLTHSTPWFFLA